MDEWLPYVISVASLLFAVYSWARNNASKRDDKQDGVRMEVAKLSVKFDTTAVSVEEIKSDMKRYNATIIDYERRLSACEQSIAQAHKRISEIRKEKTNCETENH